MNTCCITGHREIPAGKKTMLRQRLEKEVERAIADGYTHFLSGFTEGADLMFAEIVAKKRRTNSAVRLEAVIPYRGRYSRLLATVDTRNLLNSCAAVQVVSEKGDPGVYYKRNRYMVDHSSRVIAVYDMRKTGGTAYTVKYARQQGKMIRYMTPQFDYRVMWVQPGKAMGFIVD